MRDVKHRLQRGLRSARFLPGRVMRAARTFDIRKPVHAALVGLIVAGIVAPIVDHVVTNQHYKLTADIKAVAESASPSLMHKLVYDKQAKAMVFNADGKAKAKETSKDKLTASIGAGGKKDNQLYSATFPDDPSAGVTISDNVNSLDVAFVPKVGLMNGRGSDGRVTYPLKDDAGQLIFTPKGNGVKEDIVLTHAPKDDVLEVEYDLKMPSSVEPRLEDDGSIGFYTGSPELFGDISYGSDKDRELVDKARANSAKNYLMFRIPAPVIRETGKGSAAHARFNLSGKTLTVRTTGLSKANYPLSIDPTFLLTTTSDFVLGSIDDNIDQSVANQVGRQAIVGGSTPGWSAQHAPGNTGITTPQLKYAQFASSLVAYNGFLYMIGGGSGDTGCNSAGTSGCTSGTTTNDVRYITLDATTGALGQTTPTTWTGTSKLQTARQGLVSFGFNGYLYAVGGEDNSGVPIVRTATNLTVEYAKINSDGTVGSWAYTSGLNTVRSYPAGAIYQGVLYIMGGTSGTNNTTFLSTSEYSRINGDGTLGSWVQSTSSATGTLTSARSKFRGAAYGGYLYVGGGQTSSTVVINTMELAPINSDGSIGTWVATTAFPTARRDLGMMVNSGYIYVFGGCSGAAQACAAFIKDVMYAQINADGTIGQWQSTLPYNSAINDTPTTPDYNNRMPAGVASYTNHLYFIGGCSTETATNNCSAQLVGTFITDIDSVGRFDRGIQTVQTTPPYNNNAVGTARAQGAAIVLNGYIYYIGGYTSGTAYSAVVEYAAINANGSIGTFATTTSLPAQSGDAAGRHAHSLAAYNNKIYVIGGWELNTALTADISMASILSSTQSGSGTLGAWAVESNAMPSDRTYHTTVQWRNYIYVIGGRDGSTVYNTILRSQIGSGGALGAWSATTTNLTAARWAHSSGIWGNWIYVVGGESTNAGAFIGTSAANNAVEQFTITNSGDITATSTKTAFPISQRHATAYVHNGFMYVFGGITSGSNNATANIYWTQLAATTGVPGTFDNTNIGNIKGSTAGLASARSQPAGVAANGVMYVIGGCSGTVTLGAGNYDTCSGFVSTANNTEAYLNNNGGTGQTSASASVTALGTATADHAMVAYNGVMYMIGGCTAYTTGNCSTTVANIYQADINTDGSLSAWSAAASNLPTARSLIQAVAYNGYLYVIGGRTGTPATVATVTYTTISNAGVLGGSWSNADLPSGAERNAFGAAISNGYLYVAGGDNGSGTKKSDVYYAQLSTSTGGLTGSWATTSSFTTARSGLNLIAYNGNIYVIGGYTGSANLQDIQFAAQASNGTLGSFVYATDVPSSMYFRQAVAANGYMYFFGDEGGTQRISYAAIHANGTLGALQWSASGMSAAHAHGAASYYNGEFYVSGGCTVASNVCTTPATGAEDLGQQATWRLGHYSKLYNTQVDTAPTQLIINGANSGPGSAVEFRLQTASSADPVLGVAQLIRPVIFNNYYNVQALNSSGTNTGVALNYLFLIVLDDSRSATFPDIPSSAGGYAQTAVTDITLYYHANPGRRLRHGASFTDTSCNPGAAITEGCALDTAP